MRFGGSHGDGDHACAVGEGVGGGCLGADGDSGSDDLGVHGDVVGGAVCDCGGAGGDGGCFGSGVGVGFGKVGGSGGGGDDSAGSDGRGWGDGGWDMGI